MAKRLSNEELEGLRRWNTPTIYNGWEQITKRNADRDGFNLEETRDFMPQMGAMIGYAVTVQCRPGNPEHPKANPNGWDEYRDYVASVEGPKVVIVQDLDKPDTYGSFWGEVNANIHLTLGCVGTVTDGAVRDVDEMTAAGFKAIGRRMCVGHAHSFPVKWNCEVEVFGRKVLPGQLVHADKHGFLVIPDEDQEELLEASEFMDANERNTLIKAARGGVGKSPDEAVADINQAARDFRKAAGEKFGHGGEW